MTEYVHDVFVSFSFKDQDTAETIVNELTSKYGISCWICTRDIDGGKRYKKLIPAAIKAAKIVVFLQSENASESKEIPKEIGIAIDADKIIIPFKIDKSVLKGDLEYDLYGVEYIDATVPTMEQRILDLAIAIGNATGKHIDYIRNIAAKENGETVKEKLISTPNVIPKTVFYGRDEILSEIDTRYKDGDRVLFLHGIGGIGKTQIAKQYAKKYKQNYDTVIYATYNGSIKNLIISETPFAIFPEMVRYTMSDGSQESDNDFFLRKIDRIKKISNEKTLIIIDNFDVDNDEELISLFDGNYHLLITTRSDFSRYYPTIKIKPIESLEALKNIFINNYQGGIVEKDDPALVEMIELVNRHTYTIELLAQHMEISGQTVEEMICALKEQGITSLNEIFKNSEMKTQVAYENLLKMFPLFSLDLEERKILMYLSLMPTEGVNVRDFKKWADLTSLKVLNNLENRSWIIRNTNGIALHPIIRSVIKHEMPATDENCYDFLNSFSDSIDESKSWHFKKVDKDRYAKICKSLLSVFKEITPYTEALYYSSEVLLSFAIEPEFAANLAERLYNYYVLCKGDRSYEAGRAAFKLGWVYEYNSHLKNYHSEVLKWLEKAEEILESIELTTSEEKSKLFQTRVSLSKVHLSIFEKTKDVNEYLLAKKYAESNVEYAQKSYMPGDLHYNKVGGAYRQLADILLIDRKFIEAYNSIEKAWTILMSIYTENDGDVMSTLNRKAAILYSMGDYESASSIAQNSMKGYIDYFGENNPTIVRMYRLFGDCKFALNELEEAKSAYKKALEIAERLYVPDAKQIYELRECFAKIK